MHPTQLLLLRWTSLGRRKRLGLERLRRDMPPLLSLASVAHMLRFLHPQCGPVRALAAMLRGHQPMVCILGS